MSLLRRRRRSTLANLPASPTPAERRRAEAHLHRVTGTAVTERTEVPDPVWPAAVDRRCPSCGARPGGAWCGICGSPATSESRASAGSVSVAPTPGSDPASTFDDNP